MAESMTEQEKQRQWLLTKEEWEAIIAALPAGDTCGQCREALARAQLRKVAAYIQHQSMHLPRGSSSRLTPVTYWGTEAWKALMSEAGLE